MALFEIAVAVALFLSWIFSLLLLWIALGLRNHLRLVDAEVWTARVEAQTAIKRLNELEPVESLVRRAVDEEPELAEAKRTALAWASLRRQHQQTTPEDWAVCEGCGNLRLKAGVCVHCLTRRAQPVIADDVRL